MSERNWIAIDTAWIEQLSALKAPVGSRHQYEGDTEAESIVAACPSVLRLLIVREALRAVHAHMREGGSYRMLLDRLSCGDDYMILCDDGLSISNFIHAAHERVSKGIEHMTTDVKLTIRQLTALVHHHATEVANATANPVSAICTIEDIEANAQQALLLIQQARAALVLKQE